MPGTGALQVVQLSDLVAMILFFLRREAPSRVALEIAGPERLAMGEIIMKYRAWYGRSAPRCFVIPRSSVGYRNEQLPVRNASF